MMGIRSFSGILKTVLNEIQGFAFLSRSALAKIISPPFYYSEFARHFTPASMP